MKPIKKSSYHYEEYLSLNYLLKVFLLFLLYYGTADVGLKMDAIGGFAALFWLPTGISLAAVLLFGYRVLPAVFLGAFFANFSNGAPFWVSMGIASGNSLEAFTGVYLLKRLVDFHPSLERLQDVLGLIILAAFVSTMVSATIGVSSLYLGQTLTTSFHETWVAWWIGDMISNLVIAPFILVWAKRPYIALRAKQLPEIVALCLSVLGVGLFIFRDIFGFRIENAPFTYVVFPPLIWAGLRFSQREVVTFSFMLTMLAVWGTMLGYGPFTNGSLSQSLMLLQGYMLVVSSTAMILSATVSERKTIEKRKEDFIGYANHELKTPITSLKGFMELLQKTQAIKKDKKASGYLSSMENQVNKIVSLVNTMLDLSKMQRTIVELKKESFSLPDTIQEVVRTLKLGAKHPIIIKSKKEITIVADRQRVIQVLSNLVTNAIKYSPNKSKIIISVKPVGKRVTVSVKDFGLGIAPEHQEKIFESFYRITDDTNHAPPGLGIGLYLAKRIVRRHGGEIWVESIEGKGSTFYFSLPLK